MQPGKDQSDVTQYASSNNDTNLSSGSTPRMLREELVNLSFNNAESIPFPTDFGVPIYNS